MLRLACSMVVVEAEYKGDRHREKFDSRRSVPRRHPVHSHRLAPGSAQVDQKTFLLPSPHHAHPSLPWKGSLTSTARFRP